MHRLFWFFTTFCITRVTATTEDPSELGFAPEAPTIAQDFDWGSSGVNLGLYTDDLDLAIPSDDSRGYFDEEPYANSLGLDDDLFASPMGDEQWSISNSEGDCWMNPDTTTGKLRRDNICPLKVDTEEPQVQTENPPSSSDSIDQNRNQEPEVTPLSSSLLGVLYKDLCPKDKVPGTTPLCCLERPYGTFVRKCIDCKFCLDQRTSFWLK